MRYALTLLALVAINHADVAIAQEDVPPLHTAIRAGDVAEAERLLDAGADPSELDDEGRSPLIDALAYGHETLALRLLEAGADPSAGRSRGRSPILIAVSKGYPDVVSALLSAGADPNATDDRGETALHIAAGFDSGQHVATLWELIQAGADLDARDEDERSPLHEAAADLNTQAVQLLLDAGAPLELGIFGVVAGGSDASGFGSSSEMEASQRVGRMQMLRGLFGMVEGGGAIDEVAAALVSVVQSAVEGGNTYVLEEYLRPGAVEALRREGAQVEAMSGGLQEALRTAIALGNEEAVRILLDAGVPPDEADESGWTPLMSAVADGEAGIVRALLEAGADPEHVRVHRGQKQTPMSLAEQEGHLEIVALLEAAQAGELKQAAEGPEAVEEVETLEAEFVEAEPEEAVTTCRDLRCFDEAFRSCEPAVVITTDEALGARVKYEIEGLVVGEGFSGCDVSMVYRENPNPSWVNKPLRLTLDPQRPFIEEITQGLQQCAEGRPGRYACEGPLLEEIQP